MAGHVRERGSTTSPWRRKPSRLDRRLSAELAGTYPAGTSYGTGRGQHRARLRGCAVERRLLAARRCGCGRRRETCERPPLAPAGRAVHSLWRPSGPAVALLILRAGSPTWSQAIFRVSSACVPRADEICHVREMTLSYYIRGHVGRGGKRTMCMSRMSPRAGTVCRSHVERGVSKHRSAPAPDPHRSSTQTGRSQQIINRTQRLSSAQVRYTLGCRRVGACPGSLPSALVTGRQP